MSVEAQKPIIKVAGSDFNCEENDGRTSLTKI